MNTSQLTKLEKNKKFRKKITSEGIWKNYAFVPPSILLFISIFGLVYLLNIDLLVSLKAIPFAIIFLLATLWFKSVRKYIINKKITEQDFFQICLATPLFEEADNTILLFATNNQRHDQNYLEKQKNLILNNTEIKTTISDVKIERLDFFKVGLPNSKNNLFVTKIKKIKKTSKCIIIYTNNNIIYTNESKLMKT